MTDHQNTEPEQSVSENNEQPTAVNNRRRKLLGAAAGTSLIAWQAPQISGVILPAHAQTSEEEPEEPEPPMVMQQFFASPATGMPVVGNFKSPLDYLIPEAIAGEGPESTFDYIVGIEQMGETDFKVDVLQRQMVGGETPGAEILFSGTLAIGVAGTLPVVGNPCENVILTPPATLVSVAEDLAVLNFNDLQFEIPPGSGMVPMPACNLVANAFTSAGLDTNYDLQRFKPRNHWLTKTLDIIVPESQAQLIGGPPLLANASRPDALTTNFDVELGINGNFIVEAGVTQFPEFESVFAASVPLNGAAVDMTLRAGCEIEGGVTAQLVNRGVSSLELTVSFLSSTQRLIMFPGTEAITDPEFCIADAL